MHTKRSILATCLAVLLLVATGCVIERVEAVDWRQAAAVDAAAVSLVDGAVAPLDNPDDKCDACNGTGKVGDGTVMLTCTVCDGTGKLTRDDIVKPDKAAKKPTATYRIETRYRTVRTGMFRTRRIPYQVRVAVNGKDVGRCVNRRQ